MNFDFSDDQKFLKSEARKCLDANCPTFTNHTNGVRPAPRANDPNMFVWFVWFVDTPFFGCAPPQPRAHCGPVSSIVG